MPQIKERERTRKSQNLLHIVLSSKCSGIPWENKSMYGGKNKNKEQMHNWDFH